MRIMLRSVGVVVALLLASIAEAQPQPPVTIFGRDSGGVTRAVLVDSGGQLVMSANISGADGSLQDGANSAIEATVFDLTNSNPLSVQIVDATGTAIVSFGGGTQYAEDAAHASGNTGTLSLVVRNDAGTALAADGDYIPLMVNSSGALYVAPHSVTATNLDVQIGGSDTVTVAATNLDVQIGGSDTVTVQATNLDVQSGGADLLSTAEFTGAFGSAGTSDAQVMSIQGIASMTPVVVSATNLDVQIGGSDTLTVTATDLDVQSGGADILSTSAFNAAFGTAGSADTQVLSIQGIASGTAVTVSDGSGALNVICDSGCSGGTQYTEDAAAAADPVGSAISLVRADTPGTITSANGDNVAQRGTNYGAAYVQVVSSSGAFIDSFGGSGGTASTDDGAFTLGSTSVTPMGCLEATDTMDAGDVGGVKCGSDRELDVDVTNAFVLDATVTTIFGSDAIFGTAGSADTDVLTVQGIASMTPFLVNPGTATNWGVHAEDSAHSSTHAGIQALAVRQDSQADFGADGDYVPFSVDGDGALRVAITSGAGSGGTSAADDADFTDGTTSLTLVGGVAESASPTTVTEGDLGAFAMTLNRALKTTLYNSSGTEIPIASDATFDSAFSTTGPQIMIGAADFDGSALPNTVSAEGDAARLVGSLSGVAYFMPVNEDGSKSPLVEEDVASAAADLMFKVGGIRDDTLDARSGTEGDWEMFHMNANGALWAIDVNSAASLTAVQLIDNIVSVEDAVAGSGFSGVGFLAVRQDSHTDLAADGDFIPVTVDADGGLRVSIVAGAGSGGTAATDDGAFTLGTTSVTPMGCIEATDTMDAGDVGGVKCGSDRELDVDVTNAFVLDATVTTIFGSDAVFGTAGTADTDVLTVQGIASMTPLLVTLQASTNTTEVVGDAAHDAAVAGNPVLIGFEAKDFDGAALPSTVSAEGDAVRAAAALSGVQYVMVVNEDGSLERGTSTTPYIVNPGTASSWGVHAEDSAHSSAQLGIQALAVRQDSQVDFGADGDYVPFSIDDAGALRVAITSGAGSGGTALADDADFTAGSTSFTPVGGFYQSTVTACTDGDTCAMGITSGRAIKAHLTDAAGASLTLASDWTIGSAISTSSPGSLGVYADFDGSAIPTITNVDTEGEAVPFAASIKGVQYVMVVSEDGSLERGTSTTPYIVGDGSGALNVICDSGCSGGTQYAEDAAHASGNTGTLALVVRNDAGTALAADGDNIPLMVNSAGSLFTTITGTATVSATNLDVQIGGSDTLSVNPGTAANWSVYVEDAGETAGGNLMMSGSVRRDTAASSAGTTGDNATLNTDAIGQLWVRQLDPCSGVAKSYASIDIVTATTTEVTPSLAGASTNYYICSINLVTAGANNVALTDDDSDGCGSVTSGIAGGTTAGEGWNFAANGGLTLGNGNGAVAKTNGTNRVVCLVTSAAVQLSGSISYVAAP